MNNVYAYIFLMAVVTYAIRALPLTLIRKEIKSTFIRSFLYYVPYATLAAMTFPAILSATNSHISAFAGFVSGLKTLVPEGKGFWRRSFDGSVRPWTGPKPRGSSARRRSGAWCKRPWG